MIKKCSRCGLKQVQYPLFERDGLGRRRVLWKNWKNAFKMDLQSVIFIILLLTLTWLYHDAAGSCVEFEQNQCGYCEASGCCLVMANDSSPFRNEPDLTYDVNVSVDGLGG